MRATSLYLLCYDIADPKRLGRVRKVAYSFAFGGQKSAVECYLDEKMLHALQRKLFAQIDPQKDKINIFKIKKDAILLGKAKQLPFDKGAIII